MSRATYTIEPRLLSSEQAARYCGVSVPTFEGWCPVKPIRERNRVLYDRVKIDRWLDSISGIGPDSPPARKNWAALLGNADADQRN